MITLEVLYQHFGQHPEFLQSGSGYYSQNGEDVLIDKLLSTETEKGCFVDFGGYHPYSFSNTFLLYLQGWRGVNVDANKDAIELFNAVRTEDVNIHALVAPEQKVYEYFRFKEGAWNTTDPEAAKRLDARGNPDSSIVASEKIESITPNQILAEHVGDKKFDLLTIDIEGLDLDVLYSIDFDSYRPLVICMEVTIKQALSEPLASFMAQKGYELNSYCYHSAIFKRQS